MLGVVPDRTIASGDDGEPATRAGGEDVEHRPDLLDRVRDFRVEADGENCGPAVGRDDALIVQFVVVRHASDGVIERANFGRKRFDEGAVFGVVDCEGLRLNDDRFGSRRLTKNVVFEDLIGFHRI